MGPHYKIVDQIRRLFLFLIGGTLGPLLAVALPERNPRYVPDRVRNEVPKSKLLRSMALPINSGQPPERRGRRESGRLGFVCVVELWIVVDGVVIAGDVIVELWITLSST